jgi:hypothetical protein
MACENSGGLFLHFFNEGIEGKGFFIEPIESDIRLKPEGVTKAKFDLTEEDGKFVANYADQATPVTVLMGGYPATRLMLKSEDHVEFKRDVNGISHAVLTLTDASAVLSRGAISKTWEEVTLRDAVEYIFNNRDDPKDVLQDELIFSGVNPSAERDDLDPLSAEAVIDGEDQTLGFSDLPWIGEAVQELAVGTFEFIQQNTQANFNEEALFTGFDFDGISPGEALKRVAEEFHIGFYVNRKGYLIIGPSGSFGSTIPVSHGDEELVINRYDVTQSSNRTDSVLLRGKIMDGTRALHGYATAEAESITGTGKEFKKKKSKSLSSMEKSASWLLIKELRDDTNGSVTFNGSASTNKYKLSRLRPGMFLLVDSEIAYRCQSGVIPGMFQIQEVQHRVGDSRGWQTTVELARTVPNSEIDVSSYIYDPRSEMNFESISAYNEYIDNLSDDDDDPTGGAGDTFGIAP